MSYRQYAEVINLAMHLGYGGVELDYVAFDHADRNSIAVLSRNEAEKVIDGLKKDLKIKLNRQPLTRFLN